MMIGGDRVVSVMATRLMYLHTVFVEKGRACEDTWHWVKKQRTVIASATALGFLII